MFFDGNTITIYILILYVQGYSSYTVNPKGKNLSSLQLLTHTQRHTIASMMVNNAGRDGISKCLKSIKLSLLDGFIVWYKSGLRVGPEPAHLDEMR